MVTGVLWREVVTARARPGISRRRTHPCAGRQLRHAAGAQSQAIRRDRHRQSVRRRAVGRGGAADRLASACCRRASLGAKDANGKQPRSTSRSTASAPDIAGQGLANPIACILSLRDVPALFLRPRATMRSCWRSAVERVLADGYRTADIMQPGMTKVGTSAMTRRDH